MLPLIDAMQVSLAVCVSALVLMFLVLAFVFGLLSLVSDPSESD